jgi:ribosomal protein S18 acetylase RimI-like enzyme
MGSAAEVSVRPARMRDIPAVLALWELHRSAAASTPDDEPGIARLIEHARDALLVAECDGRIVGTLIAGWDGWRGNMSRLAVHAEYRRRGIARRLMESGHERLRAKGARRVTALVANDERAAAAVWREAGYDRDDDVVRFVTNLPTASSR